MRVKWTSKPIGRAVGGQMIRWETFSAFIPDPLGRKKRGVVAEWFLSVGPARDDRRGFDPNSWEAVILAPSSNWWGHGASLGKRGFRDKRAAQRWAEAEIDKIASRERGKSMTSKQERLKRAIAQGLKTQKTAYMYVLKKGGRQIYKSRNISAVLKRLQREAGGWWKDALRKGWSIWENGIDISHEL